MVEFVLICASAFYTFPHMHLQVCSLLPCGYLMGKGCSWLSFVKLNFVFVTFPCGILGQMWYLIVLIPDFSHLSYFVGINKPLCKNFL